MKRLLILAILLVLLPWGSLSAQFKSEVIGKFTDQSIKGDDVDSTAENFVFDDAYRGTSAYSDSAYATEFFVKVLVEDSLNNYIDSAAIHDSLEVLRAEMKDSAQIELENQGIDSSGVHDSLDIIRGELLDSAQIETENQGVDSASIHDSLDVLRGELLDSAQVETENQGIDSASIHDSLSLYLQLAGGTMAGDVAVGDNDITGVDSLEAAQVVTAGAASGTITFSGVTSGSASITVADVAGTPSELVLPTTDGSSGNQLTTDGSGMLSWTNPQIDSAAIHDSLDILRAEMLDSAQVELENQGVDSASIHDSLDILRAELLDSAQVELENQGVDSASVHDSLDVLRAEMLDSAQVELENQGIDSAGVHDSLNILRAEMLDSAQIELENQGVDSAGIHDSLDILRAELLDSAQIELENQGIDSAGVHDSLDVLRAELLDSAQVELENQGVDSASIHDSLDVIRAELLDSAQIELENQGIDSAGVHDSLDILRAEILDSAQVELENQGADSASLHDSLDVLRAEVPDSSATAGKLSGTATTYVVLTGDSLTFADSTGADSGRVDIYFDANGKTVFDNDSGYIFTGDGVVDADSLRVNDYIDADSTNIDNLVVNTTVSLPANVLDSNHVGADALAPSDVNWAYDWIHCQVVAGYSIALTDSIYLYDHVQLIGGDTIVLLVDSAGNIDGTARDTFNLVFHIPYPCTIDSLAYLYMNTGDSGVVAIDFRGPQLTDGENICDSSYWTDGTNRTSATWAVATQTFANDISALAGDRYSLKVVSDFRADNNRLRIGWAKLRVKR